MTRTGRGRIPLDYGKPLIPLAKAGDILRDGEGRRYLMLEDGRTLKMLGEDEAEAADAAKHHPMGDEVIETPEQRAHREMYGRRDGGKLRD